jgi:hypothetical protein
LFIVIEGKNIAFEIYAEKYGKEELEKRLKDEHTVLYYNIFHVPRVRHATASHIKALEEAALLQLQSLLFQCGLNWKRLLLQAILKIMYSFF